MFVTFQGGATLREGHAGVNMVQDAKAPNCHLAHARRDTRWGENVTFAMVVFRTPPGLSLPAGGPSCYPGNRRAAQLAEKLVLRAQRD